VKPFLLAVMAAVAVATTAPATQAAEPQAPTGVAPGESVSAHYTGRYHTHYTTKRWRPARTKRVPTVKKKTYALPQYKPTYSSAGRYIPTTYIYQKTNGAFSILAPTPAPKASAPASGSAELRRALNNLNRAAQRPAGAPPAPPNVPNGAAQAPGRSGPGVPQTN
jgi:hypothetical protein